MEVSTNVHDDKEYDLRCRRLFESQAYKASNKRPSAVINRLQKTRELSQDG